MAAHRRSVDAPPRLSRRAYEQELRRLQTELVAMTEWIRGSGGRVVVLFEGRDAAGKGGSIKRITQLVSPRVCRVVALPAPSEGDKTQWYFQRYVAHLPAAGEIVLFDRSWYNRAGVEKVMGYCTDQEYQRFLSQAPILEKMLIDDGIILIKYWFSVSDAEQQRRFRTRVDDPTKQWKLSPMDLESMSRYVEYSRAKDDMFAHTDTAEAPWYVIESDDKRASRINCIAHLLGQIPYEPVVPVTIELPEPTPDASYQRPARDIYSYVPDHAGQLARAGARRRKAR